MIKAARQFVFDTALAHIRAQGVPSYKMIKDSVRCQYKYNGLGCAFAPMISEYREEMEDFTAIILVRDYSDCLYPPAVEAGYVFCSKVQCCHDMSADSVGPKFMEEFEKRMSNLAVEYDLVYVSTKDVITENVEYEPIS